MRVRWFLQWLIYATLNSTSFVFYTLEIEEENVFLLHFAVSGEVELVRLASASSVFQTPPFQQRTIATSKPKVLKTCDTPNSTNLNLELKRNEAEKDRHLHEN